MTPLVCALGLCLVNFKSANAANLNFSYDLSTGETISGSFTGDIMGNEVQNLGNFTVNYSETPELTFDTVDSDSFFNLATNDFLLNAEASSEPEALASGTFSNSIDMGTFGIIIPSSNILNFDTTFAIERLEVTLVEGETVFEPSVTLALAALVGCSCLLKLKKA